MTSNILDAREIVQAQARTPVQAVDNLLAVLSEEAGARAIAAERLARTARRTAELTIFCTACLIVLGLLPYFLSVPGEVMGYLDFFKIILSIVILISSMLTYAGSSRAGAWELRRSSAELDELKGEIEMRRERIDADELDLMRIRYQNIVQKYTAAHDSIDRLKYQIENRDKHPSIGSFSAFVTGTEISLRQSAPRIALITVSLIMLLLLGSLFSSYPVRLPG
jgi:hypothetical protein